MGLKTITPMESPHKPYRQVCVSIVLFTI